MNVDYKKGSFRGISLRGEYSCGDMPDYNTSSKCECCDRDASGCCFGCFGFDSCAIGRFTFAGLTLWGFIEYTGNAAQDTDGHPTLHKPGVFAGLYTVSVWANISVCCVTWDAGNTSNRLREVIL